MVNSTMLKNSLIFLDSKCHTESSRYASNTLIYRMNEQELRAEHGLMKPAFPEKKKKEDLD